MRHLLLLLVATFGLISCVSGPRPQGGSRAALPVANPKIAVLDLKQDAGGLEARELAALADQLRELVLATLPRSSYDVITRENLVDLLRAHGRTLEQCADEDACEIEYGRMIGADYVISGSVTKVFGKLRLTLRCHQTDPAKALAITSRDLENKAALPANVSELGQTLISEAFPKALRPVAKEQRPLATTTPTKPEAEKPPRSTITEREEKGSSLLISHFLEPQDPRATPRCKDPV